MNCPTCGAAMRLDSDRQCLVCDFCTNIYFPEENADGVRVLEEPAESQCPLCKQPLVHAAVSNIPLLYCQKCQGMLIDIDAFLAVIQTLRAGSEDGGPPPVRPAPDSLDRRIRCPKCGNEMDTHYYAGPGNVVIDNCPDCRVNWLDHSELNRIASARDTRFRQDDWSIPVLNVPAEEGEKDVY